MNSLYSNPMFHDPDFALLAHLLPDAPICIDVGANAGQSIRSIKTARPRSTIHSFEPNPEFKTVLGEIANKFDGVKVYYVGLGESRAEMTFYIPIVNGERYLQETTMRLAALKESWVVKRFEDRGGQPTFETFIASIAKGDEFNLAPDFIKIDVEGVESEVVAGFRDTIDRHSPILLIENGDWTRLDPIISSLGYNAMMPNESYTCLVPFHGTRTNTFYVRDR